MELLRREVAAVRPEEVARAQIDELLAASGWAVQDRARLNLGAGRGVAVREFSMRDGAADYLLFVDREAVGTVKAKKLGHSLIGVEEQSAKYRAGLPPGVRANRTPLPFAYETTGIETRFTSLLDPVPRSRRVFTFHRPETLADWLGACPPDAAEGENLTLRARLLQLPPLATEGLRDCQVEAVANLERSLAQDRPRALVQMATGSGKTYTAITAIYRLLRYGGAKKVLFLVDRDNLGEQAENEFAEYVVPGDGRKFTELYPVQRLRRNRFEGAASVCITTIQRVYSILAGRPDDEEVEEGRSLFELGEALPAEPKEVRYNPRVPIELFDAIVTDECHRSIYNLWRGVLEYFDGYLIGLTATPHQRTLGFFNKNLVMEYGTDRAVLDGVNVDHITYRIKTAITEGGGSVEAGEWVDRRDRLTRQVRLEQLDDELAYTPGELDRAVAVPDQIRTVIRAFRAALATDLFPTRTEVPKTLIFAKDDAHAEDVVQIVREEFGQGNDFCKKITYRTSEDPKGLIRQFRNEYYPRVAVTVDMIATGTDIKPLEVLLFLRSVRSRVLFEQMKGRGSRTIGDTDFRQVTPGERKTHFVIVDAVGVCERIKSDSQQLERKRSVSFEKLLDAVPVGATDEDTLRTLAGRLARLAGRLTPDESAEIAALAEGRDARALAEGLLAAHDPDRHLAEARRATGQEQPDERALRAAAKRLVDDAVAPFDRPELREALVRAQRRDEQTIDRTSLDRVLSAGWDVDADDAARGTVARFREYIEAHRDEIDALAVLYGQSRAGGLRLREVKRLADQIAVPPLGLTTDRLWAAYQRLDQSRVRGRAAGQVAADLVALVRYAIERDGEGAALEPLAERVARNYGAWLAEQEARRGAAFSDEQRGWLGLIRDQVATSLAVEPGDFDYQPFVQRGGWGKARQVFGDDLPGLLAELNARLVA